MAVWMPPEQSKAYKTTLNQTRMQSVHFPRSPGSDVCCAGCTHVRDPVLVAGSKGNMQEQMAQDEIYHESSTLSHPREGY